MYDQKRIAATPANARRLISFSKLNGMEIAEELTELANQDLLDVSPLDGTGLEPTSDEKQIMQRLADWGDRGVVVTDGCDQARRIGLGYVKLGSGPLLVLSEPSNYAYWAEKCVEMWPTSKVCVYGNPRYSGSVGDLPAGISFQDSPDTSADVIITSCVSVAWHNLLTNFKPSRTLVDEYINQRHLPYQWHDLVEGMMRELGTTIMLCNSRIRASAANFSPHGRIDPEKNQLSTWAKTFVWCDSNLPEMVLASTIDSANYLRTKGYAKVSDSALYGILGVSADLATEDSSAPINYYDKSLLVGKKKKRDSSGYSDVLSKQASLVQNVGRTIEEIVARSLVGDDDASEQLASLHTSRWASAKARSIKGALNELVNPLTRALVLTEHSDLIRKLMLSVNETTAMTYIKCAHLTSASTRNNLITRFLAPDPAHLQYNDNKASLRNDLNVLIISPTDLDNSDLLRVSDYLIFGEWPTLQAKFDVIKEEYADPNQIRLVTTALSGSFESALHSELFQDL